MADVVSGLRLVGIGPRDLEAWWPKGVHLVEKWIARADGEWGIPDVYEAIAARDLQWWLAVDGTGEPKAMAITEIWNSRRRTICQVVGVAAKGDEELDAWLVFHVDIERWAKQNGCDRIRGDGRPGWDRRLAPLGYRKLYSVVVKDL